MSNELKDDHDRFVCQKCARNVARIHTLHRRTETDSRIAYEGGKASFGRLPNDGDIAAYRVDEFLCFTCCYATLEPDEIDEAAQLGHRQFAPAELEPQEVAEYQLEDEAVAVVQAEVVPQQPLRQASATIAFTSPRLPRRPNRRTPAGFAWGA